MIVYRLTNGAFTKDLSGNGAKLYGGRWNSPGFNALYTTENISLAVLEILVHVHQYNIPLNYHLLAIEIPDNIIPTLINTKSLKRSWKNDTGYSQFIGDEFLKTSANLLLKVPSAIIEQEHNFIINPTHKDISKIKIIASHLFEFDKRLYLKNE